MNASLHGPREALYDSEAALRLVDRAIGDLTGEIALEPDDPRYVNLAHLAQHLSERCASLRRSVESLGAERSRVTLQLLADASEMMGDIEGRVDRVTGMLVRAAFTNQETAQARD